MCNMYLQDRDDPTRTPRWRGITAVHGAQGGQRAGDDRQRQHARPLLRLWRSRHGGSLARGHPHRPSRPSRSGPGPTTVTTRPAEAIGRGEGAPLRTGQPADLVVLPARSLSEFMARPLADRTVIREGRTHRGRPARLSRRSTAARRAAPMTAYDIAALKRALGDIKPPRQPRARAPEEPGLLLVFAGAQAPARSRHRRHRGQRRARRPRWFRRSKAAHSARHSRSRRAARAPAITARPCRSRAASS